MCGCGADENGPSPAISPTHRMHWLAGLWRRCFRIRLVSVSGSCQYEASSRHRHPLQTITLAPNRRLQTCAHVLLALQMLFPSPLYFFDEVDCALDTSAAARVASYVRQQCSGPSPAQYLLVSHKPVVFESAGCLLGVYSNGRGSSAAVVGHFG